jgi:DNA-binding response OmpR family regulator
MATERILIVDGAPLTLKLADILLRKEGYYVRTAADPDQALALAAEMQPDLMLVDAQLPGMGGAELMRRVKQDARMRDVAALALSADGNQAFGNGWDGFVTKPLQSLMLGRQVRECLEHRSKGPAAEPPKTPGAHGFPVGIALSPVEMEGIRRRFLKDAAGQTQKLLMELDKGLDTQKVALLIEEWARAATLLDYGAVAVLAREAEKLLREGRPKMELVREALTNLVLALVEPPEASMGPVPDFIVEALRGKRVALIGFSGEEAEELCGALERASARPRLFDAHVQDGEAIGDCSVAIVRVGPETRDSFLFQQQRGTPARTLILAGPRRRILNLDPAIQSGAEELLIDGWQPEEALMRMALALLRKARASRVGAVEEGPAMAEAVSGAAQALGITGEVLLADDDLTVRLLVRSAFQGAGIKCLLAANGNEALEMLRQHRPAAAVLDINMPGMDGYEVLAAARADGVRSRVLLLTARQQEADVTRGFTLGADDYVVKPFNPPELVARVKRLLKS